MVYNVNRRYRINRYMRGLEIVHKRKRPKVDTLFSSLFFRRVLATSTTQRRVENTRVHFWTVSPKSVNVKSKTLITSQKFLRETYLFLSPPTVDKVLKN